MKNKREVLEMMLILWDHIAINNCDKLDAFDDLSLPYMSFDCPLCEYFNFDCNDCNLFFEWPQTNTLYNSDPCSDSYFGDWEDSDLNAARNITNHTLNLINKLYPEKETNYGIRDMGKKQKK